MRISRISSSVTPLLIAPLTCTASSAILSLDKDSSRVVNQEDRQKTDIKRRRERVYVCDRQTERYRFTALSIAILIILLVFLSNPGLVQIAPQQASVTIC